METVSGAIAHSFDELDEFLTRTSLKQLVVTFTNNEYMPIFERWLPCFRNCSEIPLLVVALDRAAHQKSKDLGLNCILIELKSFETFLSEKIFDEAERRQLSRLWKARWGIIQRILQSGVEVIHSDADAVWLRNPIPEIASLPFDIAASVGRRWPIEVAQQWGFVLCMGFFLIRPTQASALLVQKILELLSCNEDDDQVAINRLLFHSGASWRRTPNGNSEADIDALGLNVIAIDHALISRDSSGIPAIFHPYLKGDIHQKVSSLEKGIHQIRSKEGLPMSYFRRNPIPKTSISQGQTDLGSSARPTSGSGSDARQSLLFIHIPKTGGTSIQEMLSLSGRGHIRAVDVTDTTGAYSFAVCRNPYSRVVSSFHYLTDRGNLPPHDHQESEYVAKHTNDFREFVKTLIGATDIYRSIHLIPQHFFVFDGRRIRVNELIPLENIEEALCLMMSRFGIVSSFRHINKSQHEDPNSYYDKETRAIVSRVYDQDFDLFGYDPSLPADSAPLLWNQKRGDTT